MIRALQLSMLVAAVMLLDPSLVGSQTFQPGDVYLIQGNSAVHNITAGGDFSDAQPFASLEFGAVYGEICFSNDLTTMYVAGYDAGAVFAVTAEGGVSSFATGLQYPLEVECLPDGTILAQEFYHHRVVDITGGGDFTTSGAFITHTGTMSGLSMTSTGDLLVVAYDDAEVRIGNEGGDLSTLPLLVALPATSATSVNEGLGGSVLVGTEPNGDVYDVRTGSPSVFAHGRSFWNTATRHAAGAVLATDYYSASVFDITAGGDFSTASPYAWGFGTVWSAIAAVPEWVILSDGFESGDTSAWTLAIP